MTIATWETTVRALAVFLGAVFGCGAVGIASYVWLKKQVFGIGGSVLCGVGAVLIGLSVWQSFNLSISQNGLSLGAIKELAQSNKVATESAKQAATSANAAANAASTAASSSQNPDIKQKAVTAAQEAAAATTAAAKAVEASKSFNKVLNAARWF